MGLFGGGKKRQAWNQWFGDETIHALVRLREAKQRDTDSAGDLLDLLDAIARADVFSSGLSGQFLPIQHETRRELDGFPMGQLDEKARGYLSLQYQTVKAEIRAKAETMGLRL